MIQLSLRYKTDDHLWFTFFHEIGHVLRHGKTDVWIEDARLQGGPTRRRPRRTSSRETASFPPAMLGNCPGSDPLTKCARLGTGSALPPGIVVGRLQHDGIWPHSRGNQLKRQPGFAETGGDSLASE